MEVRDTLPAVLATIDHEPIARYQSFLFGNFRCRANQMLVIVPVLNIGNAWNLGSSDNHDMDRCFRLDVPECDDVVILVYDISRNLASDDSAKQSHLPSVALTTATR